MKVAIVHDSIAELGGAERVLQILLEVFPDADVYTAYTRHQPAQATYIPSLSRKKITTSFLQALPVEHHTSFIQAIAPWVWRSFDFSLYDLVISHDLYIMSSFVHVPHGTHIALIQSPPPNIIGKLPPAPLQRKIPYTQPLRAMYQHALKRIPHIISNSQHTKRALREYLDVHSTVIYPPVHVPRHLPKKPNGKFYLCVSRIAPDKHLELAVLAANRRRIPLKIVGTTNTPPYERYLRSLAGPTVKFLGFQSDTRITQLYRQSIAFLFPSKSEDFGIAPLEATAYGVPVIAFYGGGAKETVLEGKTGTFFHAHTPDALIRAMTRFSFMRFLPSVLHAHARKFCVARFKREFLDYANAAMRRTSADTSGSNG